MVFPYAYSTSDASIRNLRYLRQAPSAIVHQAIADDFKSVFFRLLFQHIKINAAIIIYEKYILAIVTTLGDMMWESNGD